MHTYIHTYVCTCMHTYTSNKHMWPLPTPVRVAIARHLRGCCHATCCVLQRGRAQLVLLGSGHGDRATLGATVRIQLTGTNADPRCAGVRACLHACVLCIHTGVHACMHTCNHACTRICMSVCVYAWIYVCMYVCMHMYVCTRM